MSEQAAGERGAGTRARLLEAAVAVIAEAGWGGVTTRRVAERAGVNAALVHYHFGSVAALRRAATMATLSDIFQPAIDQILAADDPVDALVVWIDTFAEVDTDQPEARVVLEAMLRGLDEPELAGQFRQMLTDFRSNLADRIARAQAAGTVRSGRLDPLGCATAVTALLDGLTLHAVLDPTVDLRAAARALRAMLTEP